MRRRGGLARYFDAARDSKTIEISSNLGLKAARAGINR